LYANAQYKIFKEQLNKDLPFIKVSESKNIKKVERQLTVAIPNYQADDLNNIYGIDVNVMTENLLRNELISTIRNEYIDMMFAIGWETHFKIGIETGKIFNISLDPSDVKKKNKVKKLEDKWKKLSEEVANFNKSSEKVNKKEDEKEPINFISYNGYSKKALENYPDGLKIERPKFEENKTKYENLSTVQNRLLDNILLAIKELQNKNLPTREKKYRLFCNMHIATALQDTAEFNLNNTILSQQSGKPYCVGTILDGSVEILVEPQFSAKDNRICISYMDNKILMAADEKIWFNTLPDKNGNRKLMSLRYGVDYLGDFSDCITFDVYMGEINFI
jgi:hypothetical protein